jgi:PAS domain S-box-containing protein
MKGWLNQDEKMFRDLAEKSPVGVFLFQNGDLKYVNQKLADIHGYSVDEIIGKKKRKGLIHPDDFPLLEEHVKGLLSGESLGKGYKFRGITKSGETIYLENYDCCITTSEGRPAIMGTVVDVTQRIKTEEELRKHGDHLEELVEERTRQLSWANERLRGDVNKRRRVEKALKMKSRRLQEVNTALKVLLKQREDDRRDLEERFSSNLKEQVVRYIRMLRETTLHPNQELLVDIIEGNLKDILSPFSKRISAFDFTPKEMEVILFVKEGRTTKQIAQALSVTMDAISRHRFHIRKKLGINKKRANLRSHLLSLC